MNGEASVEKSYTPEQLQQAFYHLDDIMNRCLIPIVLLGETAESIKKGELTGNQITVGVRKSELNEGSLSTLKTLSRNDDLTMNIDNFELTDKEITWQFKGIPICVKVIHRKYGFINNPDYVYYWGETYNIPNPFDKYWKARFLVQ